MFYNTNRSTKAAIRERELAQSGQNIISDHEKLLKIQKQEKLKGLLITKFCRKYGIIKPEKKIEKEIKNFVQGEKLTKADLDKLEERIKQLLKEQQLQYHNKNLTEINMTEPNINNVNNTLRSQVINTMPNLTNDNNSFRNMTMSVDGKNNKKKYSNMYEELAALEAEESSFKPKLKKIDFSKYGNEWAAMNIYSKLLYDQQLKEAAIKEKEDQDNLHKILAKQIEDKNKKIEEEKKLEKEYKKTLRIHKRKMDELEREKERALEEQKNRILQSRLVQIEDNKKRRKLEELREKKWERLQVLKFKREDEENKRKHEEMEEKKKKILQEQIKENEIKKQKLLEKLTKEKEENALMMKEQDLLEQRKENERINYFRNIEKMQTNFMSGEALKAIKKIKDEEEEENMKIKYYQREKRRLENEKEIKEQKLREEQRKELAKFLEMQIDEKKKNEEFEEAINQEQIRIFKIDDQKYKDDQIEVQKILDRRNRQHLQFLKKQMDEKRERDIKSHLPLMNPTEYSMNYKFLEKANQALENA